jgi:hypothetical protein
MTRHAPQDFRIVTYSWLKSYPSAAGEIMRIVHTRFWPQFDDRRDIEAVTRHLWAYSIKLVIKDSELGY